MTKREAFQWMLLCVVFSVLFIIYFIWSFFTHCIFEWPIRWDIKTCWIEQIDPAVQKASEQAANFVP